MPAGTLMGTGAASTRAAYGRLPLNASDRVGELATAALDRKASASVKEPEFRWTVGGIHGCWTPSASIRKTLPHQAQTRTRIETKVLVISGYVERSSKAFGTSAMSCPRSRSITARASAWSSWLKMGCRCWTSSHAP